jgi:hypothetical protein
LPVLPVPMRIPVSRVRNRQAQPLLRLQMRDIGVAAVIGDLEDAAAIAGERKQAVGRAASA